MVAFTKGDLTRLGLKLKYSCSSSFTEAFSRLIHFTDRDAKGDEFSTGMLLEAGTLPSCHSTHIHSTLICDTKGIGGINKPRGLGHGIHFSIFFIDSVMS
jgi:hypothetical protein